MIIQKCDTKFSSQRMKSGGRVWFQKVFLVLFFILVLTYSITGTTIITDTSVNTTSINIDGNLTLGQKITFALDEIIDNIVDGWIRITGNLNITENVDVQGNVTATYFIGNGSKLTDLDWEITGESIGNLSDVNLPSPSNSQVLKYNSTSSKWEAQTDETGNGGGDTIWTNNSGEVYVNQGYPTNLNISGNLTAKTGRTATIVVAASDSSAISKAQADYVCDGIDDDVQIQAAIDALPSGGGKIVLLEGTYTTISHINLKTNQTLIGMGYATYIYGNYSTSGGIVQAVGSEGTHKENVIVSKIRVKGIEGSTNGIYFSYCNYCRAIDNWAENIGNEAIYFRYSNHVIARGNKVSGGWKDSDGIKFTYTNHSIITGNNIKDMGSEGTCPCTSDGIELEHSEYNIITGNVIEGGNEYGISLESSSPYNNVVGNVVRKTSSTGILVTSSSDCLVSSNLITGGVDGAIGISIYTGSHHAVVSSNTIKNSHATSMWIRGANFTSVTGNVIKGDMDTTGGILIESSSNGVVSGNVIKDIAQSPGSCLYLSLGSSGNTITSNTVLNCSFRGIRVTDDCDYNVFSANNYKDDSADFGAATNNVFIGAKEGNTGIGDTTPDFSLEVVNGSSTNGVFAVSSSVNSDGDWLIIDSSGNIGINNTNPQTALHIGDGTQRNITLYSPDHNSWTCGVNNSGSFTCS